MKTTIIVIYNGFKKHIIKSYMHF